MSAAVLEQPVEQEAKPFAMPPASIGMPIAWYPGTHREEHPQVGMVVKKSNSARALVIRLANGSLRDTVRHVDDPKLKLIEGAGEQGCWDYTEEHKRIEARFAGMRAEIEALSADVKFLKELLEQPSKKIK